MSRWASEEGSAVAEAVLGVSVLVLAWLLVIYLGRVGQAEISVRSAATAAARAASLAASPGQADAAASRVAADDLKDAGLACDQQTTSVATGGLQPGGQVTARVVCTTSLAGLGLLGVPASRTAAASSTVPVDTYRGGQP